MSSPNQSNTQGPHGSLMLIAVGLIVASLASVAVGQGKTEVDRLAETIAKQMEPKLTGWRYRRVEAFQPSSTIVAQSWYTPTRVVSVTVAIRETAEDAKKEIKSFLEFRREPQELTGFGDEAHATDRDYPTIVMRRGRFVIYISTVAFVDSDPDAQTLSKAELETRNKSEIQRLGKEFAKHLSSIELQ